MMFHFESFITNVTFKIILRFMDYFDMFMKIVLGYICDICGKQLKSKRWLNRHKVTVHETAARIKCEICCKTFSSKSNLKYHEGLVHDGQDIKCEFCNRPFNCKSKLELKRA